MKNLFPLRKHVTLDKRIGETPLQTIERWKAAHPRYRDVSASYAGRLDPMASGKLLILLGEECKKQSVYTGRDKEYRIEVLLDIGSDTGDILGIVSACETTTTPSSKEIQAVLTKLTGTHTLPYPVFSSKTVAGKPLFLYALEHTLSSISIPTHEETIYGIQLKAIKQVSSAELNERVRVLLRLAPTSSEPSKALGADFRIEAVRASWKPALETKRSYTVLTLNVRCGSGTYMRTLAGRIGEEFNTRALALSIHRTKIISSRESSLGFAKPRQTSHESP